MDTDIEKLLLPNLRSCFDIFTPFLDRVVDKSSKSFLNVPLSKLPFLKFATISPLLLPPRVRESLTLIGPA